MLQDAYGREWRQAFQLIVALGLWRAVGAREGSLALVHVARGLWSGIFQLYLVFFTNTPDLITIFLFSFIF